MIRLLTLLLLTPFVAAMPPVPRFVVPEAPTQQDELSDVAALAERIAETSKRAGEQLAAGTREETLRDQKQVTNDLDALIKLLEPPPSPSDSPSGGGSNTPMNQGGGAKSPPMKEPSNQEEPSPPQAKARSQGAQQPTPMPPKSPGSASQPSSPESPRALPSLPIEESLARDFWGHLPDAPRQQMMQFYREQHMTKYKGLLADYYKSLSEKDRK